jgi:transcriptional regulator with XRE-family HTH domain
MLARLRERARVSQLQAGNHIKLDDSRISKVEQGTATLSLDDLKKLLELYSATSNEQREALALGAASRRRAGRAKETSLPDSFQRFADLEANAVEILGYEPNVIPGLLQCADYVGAIVATAGTVWWGPDERDKEITERLKFRLQRQANTWDGRKPKKFHFIIGEAALVSVVGDLTVMRQQLRHLLSISYAGRATIQVLPFSAATNPVRDGGFTILDFGDLVQPVGIVYSAYGPSTFYTDTEATSVQTRIFEFLSQIACTHEVSGKLITDKLNQLG